MNKNYTILNKIEKSFYGRTFIGRKKFLHTRILLHSRNKLIYTDLSSNLKFEEDFLYSTLFR